DNTTRLGGFFVQEEDPDADASPMTSEGIFVFDGSFAVDVSIGDKVRVQGDVTEFQGLTELSNVTLVSVCASGQPLPASVQIDLPLADLSEWESYEGMLVEIAGPLAVSDSYFLGRFGQVTLSKMGRLFRPTGVVTPGAESLELQDLNNRRRILIDDGSRIQYPDPPVPPLDGGGTLRPGDKVNNLSGVLDFRSGEFTLLPATPPVYQTGNPRPPDPPTVGGTLKVASFNLANYFTTLDTGAAICGPSGDINCRGANTASEFSRQRAKIIAALVGLNADIVGLIEIENNATASIQDLVNGLNNVLGMGSYAFIDTGTIGTDAIKNALIYKPATVTPTGSFAVLDSSVDPLFNDIYNRPSLAQTL
ncbi:MAG: ExeM/NucH family extracellular endonuclease, partial [Candidatus Omnitrophica bacterium]|nr:ExeM/NucH family extracellular endonuclease [Candidatus Omnitrophota bacterium]